MDMNPAGAAAGGLKEPVAPLRVDCRLTRAQRLTRSALFRETYEQGRSYTGRLMVCWLREGPDAALRLGVVTSRKVGGAVARVRARRRIREAWRRCRPWFKGGVDVVIVARRAITEADGPAMVKELLWLAGRLGFLEGSRETVLEAVLERTE